MASPERKISVVPPAAVEAPPSVEARLASLEEEAERLRDEVATLQDEIRWLTDEEAEWSEDPAFLSHGLLARGWVRASLLLTVVGIVALVSIPYFFHLLDASGRPADSAPRAAVSSVTAVEPAAPATPAVTQIAPRELIPAPVRMRASEIPDPTHVLSEERPGGFSRGAARSERPRLGASDAAQSPAPVRDESP